MPGSFLTCKDNMTGKSDKTERNTGKKNKRLGLMLGLFAGLFLLSGAMIFRNYWLIDKADARYRELRGIGKQTADQNGDQGDSQQSILDIDGNDSEADDAEGVFNGDGENSVSSGREGADASDLEAALNHVNSFLEEALAEENGAEQEEGTSLENASERYLEVYALNSDFAGWLCMNGTKIDYPVMYTPEDPYYYLYRSFEKEDSQSGSLFIGAGCNPDSDLITIHGHNMKNDTMFGTLDYYMDKTFYQENPTFLLDAADGERTYEVFAAARTRILASGEEGYRYYTYNGDLTEEEFLLFRDWMIDNSLYDTGVVPEYGEQLLLLSTCSYHTSDGRFVVAARRVE